MGPILCRALGTRRSESGMRGQVRNMSRHRLVVPLLISGLLSHWLLAPSMSCRTLHLFFNLIYVLFRFLITMAGSEVLITTSSFGCFRSGVTLCNGNLVFSSLDSPELNLIHVIMFMDWNGQNVLPTLEIEQFFKNSPVHHLTMDYFWKISVWTTRWRRKDEEVRKVKQELETLRKKENRKEETFRQVEVEMRGRNRILKSVNMLWRCRRLIEAKLEEKAEYPLTQKECLQGNASIEFPILCFSRRHSSTGFPPTLFILDTGIVTNNR